MPFLITYPSISAGGGPTGIFLSADSVARNATDNTVIGTISVTGGTTPYSFVDTDNPKFKVVPSSGTTTELKRSATGSLTPGGLETVTIQATDANSHLVSRSFEIHVDTVPTDIALSATTIVDNAAAGVSVGDLSTIGGRGPWAYADLDNNKFQISGSQLQRSSTGTLTPGSETATIRSTDANGEDTEKEFTITVQDHTEQRTIATLTLLNLNSSSQAANFHTPVFGQGFKMGAIASGTAPSFQLADNTVLPYSMGGVCTWPDGSLKFASFFLRVPVSIAGKSSTIPGQVFGVNKTDHIITWSVPHGLTTGDALLIDFVNWPKNTPDIAYVRSLSSTTFALYNTAEDAANAALPGIQNRVRYGNTKKNGTAIKLSKIFIHVKTNGDEPGTSALELEDLPDIKIEVSGRLNLSGTWVSAIADGITNETAYLFADGDAGRIWAIRQPFTQSASNHGRLVGVHYVVALENAAGGLAGVRHLGRIAQPYYADTVTPSQAKNIRVFDTVLVKEGSTTRFDAWGDKAFSCDFTWPNLADKDKVFFAESIAAREEIVRGSQVGGFCCSLSTTNTLPAPLSTSGLYFVRNSTSGGGNSAINFAQDSFSVINNEDIISGTSAGSGQHTLTLHPFVTELSSFFTARPDGRYTYIQGGGSVAPLSNSLNGDNDIFLQGDRDYRLKTKLTPPYEIQYASRMNNLEKGTYAPNGSGPFVQGQGASGERDDLGIIPAHYVRHAINQTIFDEQVVRVGGLIRGHFATVLWDKTTNTMPAVNNGHPPSYSQYSGMPNAAFDFVWEGGSARTFTPVSTNKMGTFERIGTDHMAGVPYYPYLTTGEPQYLDLLAEEANQSVYQRVWPIGTSTQTYIGAKRNIQIDGGNTYYGCTFGHTYQPRPDAWAFRSVVTFAALCPDDHYICAGYKQYADDLVDATLSSATDWIGTITNTYYTDHGWLIYVQSTCRSAPWEENYRNWAIGLCAGACANTKALDLLSYCMKRFIHIVETFGGWHVDFYYGRVKVGPADDSDFITSDDDIAFGCGVDAAWDESTQRLKATTSYEANNYTPTDGDKLCWASNTPTPGGIVKFTNYFIVNANAVAPMEFEIATEVGGSPVSFTGTSSPKGENVDLIWTLGASTDPSIKLRSNRSPGENGSLPNVCGVVRYAKALGATISQTTNDDIKLRMDDAVSRGASDPTLDCKYFSRDAYAE